MPKLNFSRQVLPILAIIFIIVSIVLIVRMQPDRPLTDPEVRPATAPAGGAAVVAGAGVVEPSSELIAIGSHLPGVIDRVFVSPGDTVPAGAPLFSIDSREARAAIAEARARRASLEQQLAAVQTTLNVAQQQLALYRGVSDPRAVSRQEVIQREGVVADARAQLRVVRAQIGEAEATINAAEVRLARHTVRAPTTATVLQVEARAGQFATAGPAQGSSSDPLVTMGVTRPLHVRIDIDENEIERVAMGQPAIVSPRGSGGLTARATFVRAEPLVIPKRSLTNSASERVDVRVLQVIYALPADATGFVIGQQVDGFVPARAPQSASNRVANRPTAQ
jgi:multidrug efflux pump subunit AcrA (membrane-fusion protein)